jgi:hypothetical protein
MALFSISLATMAIWRASVIFSKRAQLAGDSIFRSTSKRLLPKSDPLLGPRVHATLRLTWREAADKRIREYF